MTPHLTEVQLYDLLSATPGPVSTPARTHLAACTRCREEFTAIEQSLSQFRLAAIDFSVLHTPPRPAVASTVHRSFFALPKLLWASGLASAVAVAALTLSTVHKPVPLPPHVAVVTTTQPVSDEALLQDIDSDLSTSVPPSLQPLDTTPASSEQTATPTSN
jgi:predicted anti-sigma-YlaC factor YlaD